MSAAINAYVNANYDSAGHLLKLINAFEGEGTRLHCKYVTFSKGTESDGSIWRLWKAVDGNVIPIKFLIAGDAIAGLTAVDAGLYAPDLGAVLVDNCFVSGLDIHLGAVTLMEGTAFNALPVAPELLGKRLFEYAGHTDLTRLSSYDIALTGDTAGVNTGKISALMYYAQG